MHNVQMEQKKPRISSRSVFGSEYPCDVLRSIANFLYKYADVPNVEIEGKLGNVILSHTDERMDWPILTRCVLERDRVFRFQSEMGEQSFNILKRKLESIQSLHPVTQRRTDKFFGSGIRLSIEENSEICVKKTRLDNLNIFDPQQSLDYRISASTETPAIFPRDHNSFSSRIHDRLCFDVPCCSGSTEPFFRFDLSKVTNEGFPTNQQTVFEVEVEIVDMDRLREEKKAAERGESNSLYQIAQSLLNNLRAIAHVCEESPENLKRDRQTAIDGNDNEEYEREEKRKRY